MSKILKFIINIFRWLFLGIGYTCYLIYLLIKNILFYIGFLISNIFYILYSFFTLKYFKKHKNNKKANKPIINNNSDDSKNLLPPEQNNDLNINPVSNINDTSLEMGEVAANYVDATNSVGIVNSGNVASNIDVVNTVDVANNGNADATNNVESPHIPDYNEMTADLAETELSVNKVNFEATSLNSNDQGNLGYHVFVENNNIASKKNEDLLTVSNKEKKIISDAKTSKTAKSEEKVFKEIDEKQSFRDKIAGAFPTLFEASDERKKQKLAEKENKKVLAEADEIANEVQKKDEELGSKTVYEYVARNKEGKLEKSYYEAYSLVEVQSYLLSEGYDIYRIRTNSAINLFHRTTNTKKKMKTSDMIFFLTQLSTYLKAGITLTEAVDILSHQFKKYSYQKIFKGIVSNLRSGDNFSEALAKTNGVFPKLLVNMIKASELTGDLPETLDDMADYYNQMDKTRKQMSSALTYPTLVLILAVAVIAFVLIYVIPKFTSIFASMEAAKIPKITQFIIGASDFIKANYYYLMLGLVVILLLIKYLYSNIIAARSAMQKLAMKIPVLKDVIIYNEVTTFTKTFSSLLKHGVYITDTMNILMQITNNEIYRKLIASSVKHLKKGENISVAFKGHWAFPIPAYEMIVTGERTGKLADMLGKVADYYQELHANIVSKMKVIIEPLLIIMLTGIVGLIILAVIVPMFSIYSSIG